MYLSEDKICYISYCLNQASRICNSTCGTYKGCGKNMCEEHAKVIIHMKKPTGANMLKYNERNR